MVKLYILNNDLGKYYVGITSLDLDKRLEIHNNGKVYSTKRFRPWQIIHTENYSNFNEARQREKQIKSWHGGNAFKKLVGRVAGSSNGRTTDSESVNLGPTPSPATKQNEQAQRHQFVTIHQYFL